MFSNEFIFFALFLFFVTIILLLDLGVFSKSSHVIKFKEATIWSFIYIGLALSFYIFIKYYGHLIHGFENVAEIQQKIAQFKHPINIDGKSFEEALKIYRNNLGLEYLTGYFIEKALSIDNIFVIVLIFTAFKVNPIYYKRVLFWGIVGAVIMRFVFIFSASALIQQFHWVLYLFGVLLVFTGVKMFMSRNQENKLDVEHHPVVRFASKYFAVWPKYARHHFFVTKNNKRFITPLFLVLLVVEFSDVIFAIDSIPAIFSVTKDPYIVFFSNIFAILGLRALFFLVINVIELFHYLKIGLSVLLTFIGVKMLAESYLHKIGFTTAHSLYIVLGIIVLSIVASLIFPDKNKKIVKS